jgi:UPF0716 protein FxsA
VSAGDGTVLRLPLVLLVAFVVVPLLELWVILRVGSVVGAGWTIAALLAVSVVGAWLVKREGRSAWRRFRNALGDRVPAAEVVDGALVLVGGTLLLTPGFLTDAVGLALVIPPSRALVNRAIRSRVRHQFGLGPAGRTPPPGTGAGRPQDAADPIDVEVVDVRRNGERP